MRALVLGTGLIGASVGAGLQGEGWTVLGWDPDADALAEAVSLGAVSEPAGDPDAVIDQVDLVFLAGPVRAIIDTLARLDTPTLVTDVAGVKEPVVAAARALPRFVGGHPMAGRESSGPSAASPAMFRGASWVLTTDGSSPGDVELVEGVVRSLGAVPVRMTAREHDDAVAAVSHLPQVVASALVNLVARHDGRLQLAAGGFRDVTRIALSEPSWWVDVLAENREAVTALVRELAEELAEWAHRIEGSDRDGIGRLLELARTTRRGMSPPVAAVRVLLDDRPGEIARVGHALAASGADVRDLQLRHATRGGGGVLTLSIRPGQEQGLREALELEGFRLVD